MDFDDIVLIHDRKCFERDTLIGRLKQLKFNSLARMELFLWDLEIFLQIQSILKDKIVLKGGAAAQFYLPIEYQRTSRNKNAERPLDRLLECEWQLEFDFMEGANKGRLIRQFREEFSKEFEKYSVYPAKVLKGKTLSDCCGRLQIRIMQMNSFLGSGILSRTRNDIIPRR